jgi:hypothetical protein
LPKISTARLNDLNSHPRRHYQPSKAIAIEGGEYHVGDPNSWSHIADGTAK